MKYLKLCSRLAALLALCAALPACGKLSSILDTQTSGGAQTQADHTHELQLLPARMNPAPLLDHGPDFSGKGASAVSPRKLAGMASGERSTSAVVVGATELTLSADSFLAESATHNKVLSFMGTALFNPSDGSADDLGNLAFAMYSIDTANLPAAADSTVGFTWSTEAPVVDFKKVWIALGNQNEDRWDWVQGEYDHVITVADLADYRGLTGTGNLLLLVAVGGDQQCSLQQVAVGRSEQVATGETVTDDEDTPIPAFKPDDQPAGVQLDLKWPVKNQGMDSACSAYAITSALNYELYYNYKDFGWDPAEEQYGLSERFIYLSTAPAGPDADCKQTRTTALVLNWLSDGKAGPAEGGAALHKNAPNDTDDTPMHVDKSPGDTASEDLCAVAFSAAAQENADDLHLKSFELIACNTDDGLKSVRNVIDNLKRPLVLSMQVDESFSRLKPGDVWTVQAQADYIAAAKAKNQVVRPAAGHAMLVCGYDSQREAFRVRNSWGENWGEEGYCWIGYDQFLNKASSAKTWMVLHDFSKTTAEKYTKDDVSLPPPGGLSAVPGTVPGQIDVTWEATIGATGYEIYRDQSDNLIATVGAVTAYTDAVGDKFSHSYWVKAILGASPTDLSTPAIGYVLQEPTVLSVSPTKVLPGSTVTITSLVTGTRPMTYDWDFGAATSLGSSTEANPTVQLTSIDGDYPCTLTITNEVDVTVFPFTLEVHQVFRSISGTVTYPGGAPAEEYELELRDTPGGPVLDSAISDVDGTYSFINQPAEPQYYITLGPDPPVDAVPPSQTVSLLEGNTGSVDFIITQAPSVAITQRALDPMQPYLGVFDVIADDPDGGALVNFGWDTDNDTDIDVNTNISTFSWDFGSFGNHPIELTVTDDDGQTTRMLAEAVVGGWIGHAPITGAAATASDVSLEVVNGNPAILYWGGAQDLLYYRRSGTNHGGAWSAPVILSSTAGFGQSDMAIVNGRPAAIFPRQIVSAWHVMYKRAADSDGTAWPPAHTVVANNNFVDPSMAVISGNPAVAYRDNTLSFARAANADGDGTWTVDNNICTSFPASEEPCLVEYGATGQPAVSFYDTGSQELKFMMALDSAGVQWESGGATVIDLDSATTDADGAFSSMTYDITLQIFKVAFLRETGGKLWPMFTRSDPNALVWETPIPLDLGGNSGVGLAMFDGTMWGTQGVAYLDTSLGQLRFVQSASSDADSWPNAAEIVSYDYAGGTQVAMAIVNFMPAVAYHNAADQEIKYYRLY